MTKAQFIEEVEKYRPLIKGRGKEIADSIDMEYYKFMNYVNGAGREEEVFENILEALKAYKNELIDYIENTFAE